ATNIHLTDVWHFGSPCHPRTLQMLDDHLLALAASVPAPAPDSMKPAEDEPTPHPVMPGAASKKDEWDFLKPVSRLRERPADEPAPPPAEKKPIKEKIAMR